MAKIKIKAHQRGLTGKKVKVLRSEGKLPAIVYGKDVEPLPILLDLREATRVLRGVSSSSLLTLEIDGTEYDALVRERQRNVISGEYLHIDFLAVSLTEKVRTLVNVVLEGEPPAIKDFDAILINGLDRVEVECLPSDLPEKIVVDISSIEGIGDGVYVKDLILPLDVEILEDLEDMIVVATAPTLIVEEIEEEVEEEEEGEVEPEVIEKGKKEEDEEIEN
jgi:large subunit ribosomal protein L25